MNRGTFRGYPGFVGEALAFDAYMRQHPNDVARHIWESVDRDIFSGWLAGAFEGKARSIGRALKLGPDLRMRISVDDDALIMELPEAKHLTWAPAVPDPGWGAPGLARMIRENTIMADDGRTYRFTRWLRKQRAFLEWYAENPLYTPEGDAVSLDRFFSDLGDKVSRCKREIVISANPFDILMASENADYSSCHASFREHGNGPIAYCNDETTFMIMMAEASENGEAAFPMTADRIKRERVIGYGGDTGRPFPFPRKLARAMGYYLGPREMTQNHNGWSVQIGAPQFIIGRAYGNFPRPVIQAVASHIGGALAAFHGIPDAWDRFGGATLTAANPGPAFWDSTFSLALRHVDSIPGMASPYLELGTCLMCGADTAHEIGWGCEDCTDSGVKCDDCGGIAGGGTMGDGHHTHDDRVVCEACYEDYGTCEECEQTFHYGDELSRVCYRMRYSKEISDERLVCEGCRNKYYTSCNGRCGNYYANADDITINTCDTDNDYCLTCFLEYAGGYLCEGCGHAHENDRHEAPNGDSYCPECFAESFFTCASCDTPGELGEEHGTNREGDPLCGSCCEELCPKCHEQAPLPGIPGAVPVPASEAKPSPLPDDGEALGLEPQTVGCP